VGKYISVSKVKINIYSMHDNSNQYIEIDKKEQVGKEKI